MHIDFKRIRRLIILPLLAWRNTRRNKRRTFILAFGLIVSVSILTGIFAYIDATNAALIQRSIEDLDVDLSINFSNRSTTSNEIHKMKEHIENYSKADIISQAERIVGGGPYNGFFKSGFLIDDKAIENASSAIGNPNGEGSFVFGVDLSYFNLTQSIFSFLNGSDSVLTDNVVLVSKPLAEEKNWNIGQNLTIGLSRGYTIFGFLRQSVVVATQNAR